MKQSTQRLVMVGGVVLGGAALAGLVYMLTRPKTLEQPAQSSQAGTLTQGDIDQLLADTASTRSGPDYDYDITLGDWTLRRDQKLGYPNLAKGAIVRLKMYPTGRTDLVQTFAAQITEVINLGSFTIYKGKWVNAPGGLDVNDWLAFTSSDIASVAQSVPRS